MGTSQVGVAQELPFCNVHLAGGLQLPGAATMTAAAMRNMLTSLI